MSDDTAKPKVSSLALEIERRMRAKGWTTLELAAKTGRNSTYFRDLFSGKSHTPNARFLPDIAEALDCDVNDLLYPGGTHERPGQGREINQLHELDEIALIGFWRSLPRMSKRRVMHAIIREASEIIGPRKDLSNGHRSSDLAESCSS